MAKSPMSEGTAKVLELLKQTEGPVTLQELNEMAGDDFKVASAHLTSLAKRGYISAEKVEKEVVTVKEVNQYTLTDPDAEDTE